jgi:hypothetical protein
MAKYVQMETTNHGEFFAQCSTEKVAGRMATSKSLGDDQSLVLNFGWSGTSGINSNTGVVVHLRVPAYPPAVASAMTVLNYRDSIKKMVLTSVDVASSGTGNNRGKIAAIYTAETGTLISASETTQNEKSDSELDLVIEFTKITIDNKLTNTSGVINTTNAGS